MIALRLLWREFTSGQLTLLALAIIVSVAAMTTTEVLTDRIDRAMRADAAALLGGDLKLRAPRPIETECLAQAKSRGVLATETIEFPSVMTMPSSDFQRLCRDMAEFSKLLEIKNVDNVLKLSGKGDLCDQTTTIYQVTNSKEEGMKYLINNEPDEIIHGYFCLKHLILFNKCTSLNKNVKIHLKNDCPLIVSYDIGEFGDLCLCLAPKVPEE